MNYTPGSISLNGWLAHYQVLTDEPIRQHYPTPDDDVALGIALGDVRYEFLNGKCTAMVNGERVTPDDVRFHHPDAVMMRGRARARLLAIAYEAERRGAPGNVQAILHRGLGIDDVVRKAA